MDRLGVNIRAQTSKSIETYAHTSFDYVISVCDRAREGCPVVPAHGQTIHWGFPDPVVIQDETARQQAFMTTATRLRSRIVHFLSGLQQGASA